MLSVPSVGDNGIPIVKEYFSQNLGVLLENPFTSLRLIPS